MQAITGYPHASRDLSDFQSFTEKKNLVPINFVDSHRFLVILHLWPVRYDWNAKVWCCINVGFVIKQRNIGLIKAKKLCRSEIVDFLPPHFANDTKLAFSLLSLSHKPKGIFDMPICKQETIPST